MRRSFLALLLGLAVASPVFAWPERPVTIIVPSGPGNGGDLISRLIAPTLQQAWGQPVVVTNQPGAAGAIGVERTARSAPDGTTLVMSGDAAVTVRPSMQPPLGYDPQRDLAPVTLVAHMPNLLVVRAADGPRMLAEAVAAARAARGGVNYGHLGPGTSIQLGAEMLAQAERLDLTGVGYPTMAGLIQDVIAGRIQMSFVNAFAAAPLVRDGQLRALAVSSAQRLPLFPDVPTVAEQGVPGFAASAWFGLLAPARTPPEVVARIREDVHAALSDPATRARIEGMGAILVDNTPEEFRAFIAAEIPRMSAVLRRAGITAAP
jgi:tripartite-type tricarboxylate transporter receptor subunit TctC